MVFGLGKNIAVSKFIHVLLTLVVLQNTVHLEPGFPSLPQVLCHIQKETQVLPVQTEHMPLLLDAPIKEVLDPSNRQ